MTSATALHERPAELLQRLIRFDTTNPPGGERECLDWVRELLEGSGCSVRILARDPEHFFPSESVGLHPAGGWRA